VGGESYFYRDECSDSSEIDCNNSIAERNLSALKVSIGAVAILFVKSIDRLCGAEIN
jgi:hypothetical protein